MEKKRSFLQSYRFSLILLGAMAAGCLLGTLRPQWAASVKPLGDLFLRCLFMIIAPLIYFSIASAVATMSSTFRLLRILGWMLVMFFATGIVASVVMLVAVQWYPPAIGFANGAAAVAVPAQQMSTFEQLLRAFTTGDFVELLSMRNTLALIVFAIMTGLAASAGGEKTRPYTAFLRAGNEVFMRVVSYVMYLAPVGLGAYFANLVVQYGGVLVGSYGRAMLLYYPLTIAYFFTAFTVYTFLAGGPRGVKRFWGSILPTSLTALSTGSSYVTIPVNLKAAQQIGVPDDIAETVIPIGATLHMEGSCLAAVLKIAFVFGVFHMDFSSPEILLKAGGVALLAGMVISGIPGGGITGEVLIMTLFNLPPESLPLMNAIGNLVDPPATLVNAVGDNVSSMLVARVMGGRRWMSRPAAAAEGYLADGRLPNETILMAPDKQGPGVPLAQAGSKSSN
ncbi:MAG: dicarboxylate/amino acid:cation symporter [Phycisphaerae bacterium]|jgi:Na+/H+-dicarboxylate symporter